MNEQAFKVVVITNQSGIARGYFTEETLSLIHHKMKRQLAEHRASIDAIYYCPYHPDDDCPCRKPKSALVLKAAEDMDIDLELSYMIGDHVKDVKAGRSAGCRTIWLTTDPGQSDDAVSQGPADHIASDLQHAVEWLTQDARHACQQYLRLRERDHDDHQK